MEKIELVAGLYFALGCVYVSNRYEAPKRSPKNNQYVGKIQKGGKQGVIRAKRAMLEVKKKYAVSSQHNKYIGIQIKCKRLLPA